MDSKNRSKSNLVFTQTDDGAIFEVMYEPWVIHKNENIPLENHILYEPQNIEKPKTGDTLSSGSSMTSDKKVVPNETLNSFVQPVYYGRNWKVYKLKGIDQLSADEVFSLALVKPGILNVLKICLIVENFFLVRLIFLLRKLRKISMNLKRNLNGLYLNKFILINHLGQTCFRIFLIVLT